MAKYYAVKKGLTTGIFDNWDTCKQSVNGYPGAIYKSFTNINDAYAFMGWESISDKEDISRTDNEPDMPHSDNQTAIAYVDGSFNVATNIFSYGMVIFFNQKELHMKDSFEDETMATMRNVAGEIYGSMAAMRYAMENNIKNLIIYHDYEGIAKWPLGLWKTNKDGTIAYKQYYDSIKDQINITFKKVKGHSGDKYNDLADKLAKEAAGVN